MTNLSKRIIAGVSLWLVTAIAAVSVYAQGNLSAAQILNKTISVISASKGVETKFKIYNSGYSGSGVIKTQNGRYNVTLPDVEVWYNGKDLFTYNKHTSETTIITPTAEELAESNPLAYVTGANKNYNVAFSTVKKQGMYVLELTPKTKGSEIKRVTLSVGTSDFYPKKIVVETNSGSPISADISDFKTAVTLPASTFEYPKNKYPKVEIIDLR